MKKRKKRGFYKKIIKKFYFEGEHTIECRKSYSTGLYTVFLDGNKLERNESPDKDLFVYFRTTVAIGGTFLEIIVSMNKIYVLKDGVDLDTGIVSEPLVIPYWYKKFRAVICVPPILLLLDLFYHDTDLLDSYTGCIVFVSLLLFSLIIEVASFGFGEVFIFHPLKTSKNRERYSLISLILGTVIGMCPVMIAWWLI